MNRIKSSYRVILPWCLFILSGSAILGYQFVKCTCSHMSFVLTVATCSNSNFLIFFLMLRAFPSAWPPSLAFSLACSSASFDFISSAKRKARFSALLNDLVFSLSPISLQVKERCWVIVSKSAVVPLIPNSDKLVFLLARKQRSAEKPFS